jgi:hypothetical protein
MKRYMWLLLTVMLAASCSEDVGPEPINPEAVNEAALTFMRLESASAITVRTASFWAVKGEDVKLEMDYADGSEFLEFILQDKTLLRAPNGRLYQDGDSVHITVTLDPSNRVILHFEPSGLTFNPAEPARLKINYAKCDDDIDNDGARDADDEILERQLQIWKQEQPGQPWFPQASFRIDGDDIEARIFSFTGFAMAS